MVAIRSLVSDSPEAHGADGGKLRAVFFKAQHLHVTRA